MSDTQIKASLLRIPTLLGRAVIGTTIAGTADSSWTPAQATVTATEVGRITTAPAISVLALAAHAVRRPLRRSASLVLLRREPNGVGRV